MGERLKEVKTYRVDYVCDVCEEGRMKRDGGIVLMSEPPQYPHVCDKCGARQLFENSYPYITYRVVEGDS